MAGNWGKQYLIKYLFYFIILLCSGEFHGHIVHRIDIVLSRHTSISAEIIVILKLLLAFEIYHVFVRKFLVYLVFVFSCPCYCLYALILCSSLLYEIIGSVSLTSPAYNSSETLLYYIFIIFLDFYWPTPMLTFFYLLPHKIKGCTSKSVQSLREMKSLSNKIRNNKEKSELKSIRSQMRIKLKLIKLPAKST